MNKTYSERDKELDQEMLNKFSLQFLKSELVVDTEYEPENEGDPLAYRTKDYEFMFVPHVKDGTIEYSIEVGVTCGGSYWEPPDYDQVEIGRAVNLSKAITTAARWTFDQSMNNFMEGLYHEKIAILEKEFPVPFEF